MRSPDPFVRLAAMEAELAALIDTATVTAARLCRAQVELAALYAARRDAVAAVGEPVAGPPQAAVNASAAPSPEAAREC